MSIGSKSWASSSSFYKRSSEFLTFELRFWASRLNGKLKNITFFSANYLKSDNFKGNSVIFCWIWIGLAQIAPKSNLWVKLRLKIFVIFCEKSIFERIFKLSLKWASLQAQKPELEADLELRFHLKAWAYKLRNNQNWALSSALAYALHYFSLSKFIKIYQN
jgi:hypothetical protein